MRTHCMSYIGGRTSPDPEGSDGEAVGCQAATAEGLAAKRHARKGASGWWETRLTLVSWVPVGRSPFNTLVEIWMSDV